MARKQTAIAVCDGMIAFIAVLLAAYAWPRGTEEPAFQALAAGAAVCAAAAGADFLFRCLKHGGRKEGEGSETSGGLAIQELILLDENNKPVKSWPMAGKTSLVLGRKNDDEEVEVDLEDCEFGSFIESQHAALNYCLDAWYLEDLGSTNGTRIQKAEDGLCYKLSNRPCRVTAGDIIYIANTRLLLS